MKAKTFYAYACIVLLALVVCMSSCGDDDNTTQPVPVEEPKGEVSYVVDNGNGGGSETTPAVVKKGEPLNVTISQKSSYTNSEGEVITREPKASISLISDVDVIYVKDLATLTSVKQKGNPETTTSGTDPVLTKISQAFEIDGKTISTFDLGYEIYRYTDSQNQTIELPYLKLKPAAYGETGKLNPAAYGETETASGTRSVAAVTGIRLTPLTPVATTRGVVVKDTVMYKVNVSFNVPIESQNTDKSETSSLPFEVEFTAAVENATELPDPTTGFNYQLNILGGTASTASPFVVIPGEALSLEWIQNSQYTYFSAIEFNGKTVGETPKAFVKLAVSKDTLWAASADELEKVTEATPVETTNEENPIKHITKQSFNIGGKTIDIESGFEAYKSLIIDGNEVNLPYLELSKAEVVSVSKTELSGQDIPNNISKAYEITVKLRQTLSGAHTPETVAETEEYIVKYIAAIVSAPVTHFDYQLNILGGTASTASPFAVTLGQELSLEWLQNSQYTYFSTTEFNGKTVKESPKASVKLNVSGDTLWVTSADELEKVTEATPVVTTSGENPTKHIIKQSFNIGGKTINVESGYEAYAEQTINGNKVNLPYLELSNAEVVSVNKVEIPNDAPSDKMVKAYEITVKLRQTLSGEHTPETVAETEEYIVKYIAAVEIKLVSTTYEKDYLWTEPHDNMPWLSYYKVHRTRTYSNGDKEEDTFTCPYGHMVESGVYANVYGTDDYIHASEYQRGEYHFVYHNRISDDKNDDFVRIFYYKTGVPDLTLLSFDKYIDDDTWNNRGNLSDYKSLLFGFHYNPESPQEGWYYNSAVRSRHTRLIYKDLKVRTYVINVSVCNPFLYIDGQIIDFLEYLGTCDYDFREEATTLSDGTPARVFTNECKAKYFGKDCCYAIVDTVYQLK